MEKDKRKKALIWGLGGCVVIIALIYVLFFAGNYAIHETTYVFVDNNDNADSIAAKLESTAHPRQMIGYKLMSTMLGMHVHEGRYAVKKGDGTFTTFRKLRNGRQDPVQLTIPNVRTMDRMAGFLSQKLMLDSATVAKAFADEAFCNKYGKDTASLACLFIPNTYEVYWNITLDKLMKRMVDESDKFWTADRREKAKAAGMTPDQVVTLASIIDEETANDAEKPMVAGMYINRFHNNMPLQADPTIKFAWKRFDLHRIYNNLLFIKSPYNTYRNLGFPPGPIRIPTVVSIEAVLNYVHHNYTYMCAKEDLSGTHNFASTYAEHMANAKRYAEALDKRGIK